MGKDPIRGATIRWTFEDGPMAGKKLEHTFAPDGTVTWREADGKPAGRGGPTAKYQTAAITDDVHAVSYLSHESGYTLTSILDFASGSLVSFASNEKELVVQHGSFERVASRV
jgi:hypothetical protein